MTSVLSSSELQQSRERDEERSRKMRQVHTELEPSAREIVQRLHMVRSRRAFAGSRTRKGTIPVLLGVALGLLLSGSAFAWALTTGRLSWSPPPAASSPAASPSATASQPTAVPAPSVRRPLDASEALETAPRPPTPNPSVPAAPTKAVSAPDAPLTTSPRAPRFGGPREDAVDPGARAAESSWADVVAKLRTGESAEAQIELENLEKSESQETREAARLLRLQLQEKRQDLSEQELLSLKRLSESALSPSVRASAKRLLKKTSLSQN